VEKQLIEATETLAGLAHEKEAIEGNCEAIREEIAGTSRDLELLAAGELLLEDKERLAMEAGLELEDTNLRDGPPRRMAPQPLTPRAIKEKIFTPPQGHYSAQRYGGSSPQIRAVFGGSLGKFHHDVIAAPAGKCVLGEDPQQVPLRYETILDLSSDLLAHHFYLNKPFRDAVKEVRHPPRRP